MSTESGNSFRLPTWALLSAISLLIPSTAALATGSLQQMPLQVLLLQQSETAEEPAERREYQLRRRLLDSTASEDSWEPEMGMPAIYVPDEMLDEADQAVAAGRLFEPANDNALARYLQVLEREPDNERAETGIDAIAVQLVQRGEAALAEGRVVEAARLLAVVNRVRPAAPGVAALRSAIEAEREIAALLIAADDALAAGQLVVQDGEESGDATSLYRQVLALSPENSFAAQGLVNVEAALLAQAQTALDESRFEDAIDLVEAAASVSPDSGAVAAARQATAGARQRRAGELIASAQAALAELDADRAEQIAAQVAELTPEHPGLAELRFGIQSVRAYADLTPGEIIRDGAGPEMVVIPIGSAVLGSPEGESGRSGNEGPQLEVRFTRGFAIARTEITVGQFREFVNATEYRTDAQQARETTIYDESAGGMAVKPGMDWRNDYSGERARDDHPVVHVSWNDAAAYASWLADTTGLRYRLPSEAEFEYSMRAGSGARYWWGAGVPEQPLENLTGDGDRAPSRRSWSNAFSNYSDGHWGPGPVASYPANGFGLHDMGGNVSEWTQDCWNDSLAGMPGDGRPRDQGACERRAIRGGSWISTPDQARAAMRLNAPQTWRGPQVGFRVLRELL